MLSSCLDPIKTIYRTHYIAHPPGKYAYDKAEKMEQTDEPLISNQLKQNLIVNGINKPTKVWPKAVMCIEEYKDFLRRLQCCRKEVYKMYFRCPEVDPSIIERMLKDLEKTTYQFSYSPNQYVTHRDKCLGSFKISHDWKYHETTYRTYYNRIEELKEFRDVMYGEMLKVATEDLKNELRQIYKCGKTIYYTEICIPALEKEKRLKLKDRPFDPYTDRRY